MGHPVDVASGEQFTAAHDTEVPGVAPLIFRRVYSTRFLDRAPSVLGVGWVHAFEATLEKDLDGFVFEGHDGDRVEFDDIDLDFERRGSLINASASMELRREGERLVVYHWHDQQGVPQELVDEKGKLVWQGVFDDWGKLIAEQGSTTCRLRLPGQIADDETGLHYSRFRYYSPDAGQFISPDPIRYLAGPNVYRFACNAINWIDPLGLTCGRTDLHVSPARREHILEKPEVRAGFLPV